MEEKRTAIDGGAMSAGSSLDALISSFSTRVADLKDLVIARNMHPGSAVADLSSVEATVRTMEAQVQAIRIRMQEERNAIPKAKVLVDQAQRQQRQLQHMVSHIPSRTYEHANTFNSTPSRMIHESSEHAHPGGSMKLSEEVSVPVKERKGGSAPRWYVTSVELDSLSSYMRGRLTLDKVNIAINEIACYADAVSQLVACPKKKLSEETWERALLVRDIAVTEAVKGKYFFLESDIKGPGLKLDNTGKAILTVLRHLGRINDCRIGQNRVFTLLKPS